ncbi:hypothetical protein DSECCO2_430380 [anaerobic digester metagenome]
MLRSPDPCLSNRIFLLEGMKSAFKFFNVFFDPEMAALNIVPVFYERLKIACKFFYFILDRKGIAVRSSNCSLCVLYLILDLAQFRRLSPEGIKKPVLIPDKLVLFVFNVLELFAGNHELVPCCCEFCVNISNPALKKHALGFSFGNFC